MTQQIKVVMPIFFKEERTPFLFALNAFPMVYEILILVTVEILRSLVNSSPGTGL